MSMTTQEAVRNLRKALGLSQEAFARKIGVTGRTISKYETRDAPDNRIIGSFLRLAVDLGLDTEAATLEAVIDEHVHKRYGSMPETQTVPLSELRCAKQIIGDLETANAALRHEIYTLVRACYSGESDQIAEPSKIRKPNPEALKRSLLMIENRSNTIGIQRNLATTDLARENERLRRLLATTTTSPHLPN